MPTNPYRVLNIAPTATDEEIRAAYVARVREFPPDREPERFEQVRDAYARLSDSRERAAMVLDADPEPPFTSVLDRAASRRPAAGLDAWLAAIAEANRGR